MREEAEEYLREDNDRLALEELADLLEVIRALAVTHGGSPAVLEQIRAEKANTAADSRSVFCCYG